MAKRKKRQSLQDKVILLVTERPANLSLEALADKVDISVSTLSRFKQGETPNAPCDLVQNLYEVLTGTELAY